MNNDDKILKALEDLKAGQNALNSKVDTLEQGQKALEAGQQALTGKVDAQGKLLNGITATMATMLEEQQAQRVDIRSLHTELHEVKGEVRAARDEAKRDTIDLKATVVKKIQSLDRRVTNIEEHDGIENPDKN
jgi:peptidoglycan hydrolase CwlO-like protein